MIAVLPKNYRAIALRAIEAAEAPIVLMNKKAVTDFSEKGPVTQKGIAACRDFEIRDGSTPILGFHDRPREMWVSKKYMPVALDCAEAGWLKVEFGADSWLIQADAASMWLHSGLDLTGERPDAQHRFDLPIMLGPCSSTSTPPDERFLGASICSLQRLWSVVAVPLIASASSPVWRPHIQIRVSHHCPMGDAESVGRVFCERPCHFWMGRPRRCAGRGAHYRNTSKLDTRGGRQPRVQVGPKAAPGNLGRA